ncbi:MAG TPA: LON peptidase substrate-binding domain-containing protein [Acidimicrobiales bacterium]|nr:LON peptidase substrate-binding domain-containing protein [Acidimicrobiales bacterium]
MGDEHRLAMFPVSTVLFPYGQLPLHVFEPRYRSLVTDCLAGDRHLGTVLISRGSEVGGGDERFDVGTAARIEEAEPRADGRWHLVVGGLAPIRVRRWLDDRPYPSAVVEDVVCAPTEDGDELRLAHAELLRVRALLSELGQVPAIPPELSLGHSPDEIAWRLCGLAPVNPFDRQRLLEAPGPEDRLRLLLELLHAVGDDVRRILSSG